MSRDCSGGCEGGLVGGCSALDTSSTKILGGTWMRMCGGREVGRRAPRQGSSLFTLSTPTLSITYQRPADKLCSDNKLSASKQDLKHGVTTLDLGCCVAKYELPPLLLSLSLSPPTPPPVCCFFRLSTFWLGFGGGRQAEE